MTRMFQQFTLKGRKRARAGKPGKPMVEACRHLRIRGAAGSAGDRGTLAGLARGECGAPGAESDRTRWCSIGPSASRASRPRTSTTPLCVFAGKAARWSTRVRRAGIASAWSGKDRKPYERSPCEIDPGQQGKIAPSWSARSCLILRCSRWRPRARSWRSTARRSNCPAAAAAAGSIPQEEGRHHLRMTRPGFEPSSGFRSRSRTRRAWRSRHRRRPRWPGRNAAGQKREPRGRARSGNRAAEAARGGEERRAAGPAQAAPAGFRRRAQIRARFEAAEDPLGQRR